LGKETNMTVQQTGAEPAGQESESDTNEYASENSEAVIYPRDATMNIVMDTVISKFKWGSAINGPGSSQLLYLRIQEVEIPLVLEFDEAIIIGRQSATEDGESILDLTAFGGNEKGVSRRHAAIRRMKNSIVLVDLGSSNNSYINGQRLASHEPYILIEGDEIRLGNLVASISFGPIGKAIR
jgi:hypothetical protein